MAMPRLPLERRNASWWHASNAIVRLAILRGATRPIARNVIVNEYPKSGGTWLAQMLSEAIGLPFPRNRLPMLGSCLMQCHVRNPAGMRNVVVIWRDGRDVMLSFYHHLLIGHEFAEPGAGRRNAARIGIRDPENVADNLPRFIEAAMTGRVGPGFTWPEFVAKWHGRRGVVETSYERLHADAGTEITRIAEALGYPAPDPERRDRIIAGHSFETRSGRLRGQERRGSFLRKGAVGDWREQYSDAALDMFNRHAAGALQTLGYAVGNPAAEETGCTKPRS